MKKLLTILMLLAASLPLWAETFQVDGFSYYTKGEGTVAVTSGGSYSGAIVIPSTVTYNGTTFSVTSIGSAAFYDCTGLTSITIPNSVTSIGEQAFRICTGLTSITIPNSVTSIGEQAFSGCKFSNIYFDDIATICNGVWSALPRASAVNLYLNGELITELVIPDGITTIGNYAFQNCTGLTSVTIPNSVTSIGNFAFRDCTGLTEVTIGENVATIGGETFWGCTGLTSITIPNSVTSIGYAAFNDCTGLTEVTIGENVATIGQHAFEDCTGLTNLTIPNSVTSIESFAFNGCTGLTSITLGNGVTSIGGSAFSICDKLSTITCNATTPPTVKPNAFENYNATVYVPSAGLALYQQDAVWSQLNLVATLELKYRITDANNKYVAVIQDASYTSYNGAVIIPSTTVIDGVTYTVTSIDNNAFEGCTGVTDIIIPNSVTSIGERAFYGCTSITDIVIPQGVTKIADRTFNECTGLTSVTIPGSVTSIGISAFSMCAKLTDVTIPEGVTKISNRTFNACSSLTSITIPSSVTIIEDYAFYGCTGLTSITLGNGVTSIGSYAFQNCTGLTCITIPNSVTSIGNYAFNGCTSIKEVKIEDGDAILSLGYDDFEEGLFYDCPLESLYLGRNLKYTENRIYGYSPFYNIKTLKEITIGNSVTSIGTYAFKNCTGLTSITIPNSVTSIGNSAFEGCTELTSITIPNSVTSIGSSAFNNCKFSNIYFDDIASICNGVWSAIPRASAVNLYHNGELVTELVIPDSITAIDNNAFQNCTGLTSVTIGNGVTSIGSSAFSGCTGLTSITIPNNVISIGERAFQNCTGLTEVTISNGVSSIPSYCFYGCTGLTSITIPNSVTSIGSYAFNSSKFSNIYVNDIATLCNGVWSALPRASAVNLYLNNELVTELVIPDGITAIGNNTFQNCTGLTSVTIPNSVTSIGNSAFAGCTGLTSITIPNSVTSIDSYAFHGCTGLTSITIPNSVTSIGSRAFYSCTGLTEVTIGNGVSSIPSYCFYGCTGLTEIVIGSKVSTIGDYAFNGCTNLTSITIPNSVTSIGRDALPSCTISNIYFDDIAAICNGIWSALPRASAVNLYYKDELVTELVIPDSITAIGNNAFQNCTGLTSVTIPNSVTSIGNYAFNGCTGLTSITLGNGVTSIGRYAFQNCTGITSITIPESITSIDWEAFAGCIGLTTVNFNAEKCTTMGGNGVWVFENCSNFTKLNIGDSVQTIPDYAFQNCTGLTEITIPNSVTSIGQRAFGGCSKVTSLTIPGSVTSISDAFNGCNISKIYITDIATICKWNFWRTTWSDIYLNGELVTDVVIPDGVTEICASAFSGCRSLTSVTIPNSVTYISSSVFKNCNGLTEITIPNSVTSIESNAFSGCSNLKKLVFADGEKELKFSSSLIDASCSLKEISLDTLYIGRTLEKSSFKNIPIKSVTISDNVTSLPAYMFYNNAALIDVSFGNNITSIGGNAFKGCSNLKGGHIQLPASLDSIASNAFAGINYTSCTMMAAEPPVVADAAALGNISFVRVPNGSGAAYRAANVWKDLTIIEEDPEYEVDITVTEPGKLSQDIVMEYMIVPQSVTKLKVHGTINVEDFKQMRTNMTSCYSIDLSDADCVALPDSAFEGKYYLTELILPNNCESIGKSALINCTGIDSLIIPDNVKTIGEKAFVNCINLKYVKIGSSVSTIGNNSFKDCVLLKNITIPSSVRTIGQYAFENCSMLTSIVIPEGVTSIGIAAFINCKSLKSASIPSTVKTIYSYTFESCTSLSKLTLSEGLKSIQSYAIRTYSVIDTLVIPTSLSTLGRGSIDFTVTNLIIADSNEPLKLDAHNYGGTITGLFQGKTVKTLYIGRNLVYDWSTTFPNTITSVEIGPYVTTLKKISDCPNLKSMSIGSLEQLLSLTIESHPFATSGNGTLYIGGEAVTNLVIPDNITAIKDYTFMNCTNIETVTLPDTLMTIGNQAFKGCTSLTTANLSDSLKTIGNEAFYDCEALANITCPALVPPTVGTDGFEGVDNYTCILTIPGDSLMNYMLAEHWGAFIQKRKRIDVNVDTPIVDEEESDGESESGSEGDSNNGKGHFCGGHIWYDRDWHKHHGGHHAPRRYAAAEEPVAVNGIDATIGDGLSLFIATDSVVSFLIEPEEGYAIGSVRYGGVDVTNQLNNGVFTTSAVSANTTLEVSFVEGDAPVVTVMLGDANNDAVVNVSDAVVIVNYILGDESAVASLVNADANEDGVINVADVVSTVNIILSQGVQAAPMRYEGGKGLLAINDLVIAHGETAGIEVSLDNEVPYTAFQMDVTLPDGLTVNDIALSNRLNATHSMMWRMQDDNTLRVVVFAVDNSAVADNSGALFTIEVTADAAFEGGNIVADNAIFTVRDLTIHHLDTAVAGAKNTAGVDGIYTADRIYTMGRTIVIESTCDQVAYITTTGGVMRAEEVKAGRNEITLSQQGLYIVVVGSETQKLIIR